MIVTIILQSITSQAKQHQWRGDSGANCINKHWAAMQLPFLSTSPSKETHLSPLDRPTASIPVGDASRWRSRISCGNCMRLALHLHKLLQSRSYVNAPKTSRKRFGANGQTPSPRWPGVSIHVEGLFHPAFYRQQPSVSTNIRFRFRSAYKNEYLSTRKTSCVRVP